MDFVSINVDLEKFEGYASTLQCITLHPPLAFLVLRSFLLLFFLSCDLEVLCYCIVYPHPLVTFYFSCGFYKKSSCPR